jgi:hypothetical protein
MSESAPQREQVRVMGPPRLSAPVGRVTRLGGVAERRGPVVWRADAAARDFWGPGEAVRREAAVGSEARRAGGGVVRIWGPERPLRLGTPLGVTAPAEKSAPRPGGRRFSGRRGPTS